MKVPVLLMVRDLGMGGTQRQVTEIAKTLDRNQFEPHIAAIIPQGIRAEELRTEGIPVLGIPFPSFQSIAALKSAWNLLRYIHQNQIRLVHTFDVNTNIFGILIVKLFTRVPAIASQRAHRQLARGGIFRKALRLADRFADGIVVNCLYLKEHMEAEGVPERSIHVCYNGINLQTFQRRSTPVSAIKPANDLTIGTVCVLRPEKGVVTLIEAFAALRQTHFDIKLLIVGSGPCLPQLQSRAKELGVFFHCIWQPAVENVSSWLQQIDIFVLPSRSEAFSNSLMEAMASGCCAVASSAGGNPELVDGQSTGLLFQPGNAKDLREKLQLLAGDEMLRRRLANAGHDLIHSRFSRQAAARRMEEIYASFLSRNI